MMVLSSIGGSNAASFAQMVSKVNLERVLGAFVTDLKLCQSIPMEIPTVLAEKIIVQNERKSFLLLVSRGVLTKYECQYGNVIGVGRWHRPNSSQHSQTSMPIPRNVRGPSIGFGLINETLVNFCHKHQMQLGYLALGIKMLAREQMSLCMIKGASLPTSRTFNYSIVRPQLRVQVREAHVRSYRNNVFSKVEAPLPQNFEKLDCVDLFIRTSAGRLARIAAGSPLVDSFVVSPSNFTLSKEESSIVEIVRPVEDHIHVARNNLLLTCNNSVEYHMMEPGASMIQLEPGSLELSDSSFISDLDSISLDLTEFPMVQS